jgi:salicylate hydroxylase
VQSSYNCRVTHADPSAPSVTISDGRTWSADLIIASDGLHSYARSIVLGRPSAPISTGQMAYRVTLPAARLEGIPELAEFATEPRNNFWIGPKAMVLSYLLQGIHGRLLNFIFMCDIESGMMPDGVDQKAGTAEDVRKAFKGWDPRLDIMLEHVPSVLEWRLYTHEHITQWVHPDSKFCLIGDSAHAMMPYLAQGAAMGIEDAAILGGVLTALPSPEDLPKSLKIYEKLRVPRANMVSESTMSSKVFTGMDDGPEQRERDEYLLKHPGIESGHRNLRSRKEFVDELYGYDVFQALEEELKQA